ncbi:hydroxyproline O-galactosyltransferase GALT3 isoform X2 [Aristolochia californica]|uniref:hydroxyproline O-galactosyltransferase GALT3 isoform X2 n=1 Tax=Aristolochia californica TaxID=171875 RepID=UPI0035E239E3
MRKWTGGTVIVALAIILVIRYSLMETHPRKQSPYDFFNGDFKHVAQSEDRDSHKFQMPERPHYLIVKPYLITVEGLDDLYSVVNVSEDVLRVTLLWGQMHDLMSRPDSLPDTAQGVKEASIAWKELIETIEKETPSGAVNSDNEGNNIKEQHCPLTLSALNLTSPINETLLEFPCGLVEDSSITVVGIPSGDFGSFQFKVVGARFPGEQEPPIIFHYNVSLQGGTSTDGSIIVQNSWTTEYGWGEEEKCPTYGSSATCNVDGLVCCNEQMGGSVVEDNRNINMTELDKRKALNTSKGTHLSVNFPFIADHPFAATLWVGREGFHMTVNGRHETSFSYRERLEPWLVNDFRVGGGLDVLSVLANGLPASEDPDLIVGVEHLKAPPVSKKRILLLVGIFSTGNNFERRMAVRRSWMQYKAVRSGDVVVRFFIGFHKNKQVNSELWREAQIYGDIQLMPFVDYYALITLKTIAICIFGTKVIPAKYIMKTDDDAFVRVDEVLSNLREKNIPNGLLYGLISFDSAPIREGDSKWYISEVEWPYAKYPPWAHGPGYIISRDVAKFIVQGHQERDLKVVKLTIFLHIIKDRG